MPISRDWKDIPKHRIGRGAFGEPLQAEAVAFATALWLKRSLKLARLGLPVLLLINSVSLGIYIVQEHSDISLGWVN